MNESNQHYHEEYEHNCILSVNTLKYLKELQIQEPRRVILTNRNCNCVQEWFTLQIKMINHQKAKHAYANPNLS